MKPSLFSLPLLLLAANVSYAEFYTDKAALEQLLRGNSLVGTYNELQFIQVLSADGKLEVAVKGEKETLKATWFINDQAEYCEQWPDHTSCFRIGLDQHQPQNTQGQRLKVQGKDDARIVSYLHRGIVPLSFD